MKLTPEQQQLVEEHWEYAKKITLGFAKHQEHWAEDLYGAAAEGLCSAASRFDVHLGVTFKTYLVPRVRGAIQDYLRIEQRKGFVPVPREAGTINLQSLDRNLVRDQYYTEAAALTLGEQIIARTPPPDARLLHNEEARKLSGLGGVMGRAQIAIHALLTDPECPTMERAGRRAGISESRVSQAVLQVRAALLIHTEYGEQARRICDRRPRVRTRTIGYSRKARSV